MKIRVVLILCLFFLLAFPLLSQIDDDPINQVDFFENLIFRDGPVTAEELVQMEALYKQLVVSPEYELAIRLRAVITQAYERNRMIDYKMNEDAIRGLAEMQQQASLERMQRQNGMTAGLISSASVTAASLIMFNTFWYLSDDAFGKYLAAESSGEASRFMSQWQTFDLISYISLGTGTLGLISSSLFLALSEPQIRPQPDREYYLGRYRPTDPVDLQLKNLEAARAKLITRFEKDLSVEKGLTISSYTLLGLGVTAFGSMTTALIMANDLNDQMQLSSDDAEKTKLMEQANFFNALAIGSGITGTLSLSLSGLFALIKPEPEIRISQIEDVDILIQKVLDEESD